MQTGDSALMKQLNRGLIIDTIRKHSPLSRSDVSRMTGLNKSTVSVLTAELVDEDLVVEVGPGNSSGGRRPRLIRFNSTAGLALGMELGGRYVRGVLCDLMGKPLKSSVFNIESGCSPEEAVVQISRLVEELLDGAPHTRLGVLGVGMGIAGTIDVDKETILVSANLGWRDIPIKSLLQRSLDMPVFIENEANAAALGEKWSGMQAQNLVYIHLGFGVGAGIIINGQLFTGSSGIAGEVGHMSINLTGPVCRCGNRGCWELYASERLLTEKFPELNPFEIDDVVALAESGDNKAINALRELGEYLGIGVTTLINIFDPDLVSVGGSLSRAGKWIIEPAVEVVQSRSVRGISQGVPVIPCSLGMDACAMGAACMLLENEFGSVNLDSCFGVG